MDWYHLTAFTLFAFVASVTPGPANVAIFSQAAKNAWLKTIPFAVGITVGFGLVLCASTYLYLSGSTADGNTLFFLKIVGSLYLLWISYQIIKSSADLSSEKPQAALTFCRGLLIHPLSYKAWLFVLLSYSSFLAGEEKQNIFIYATVFLLSSIISLIPWVALGHIAQYYLDSRKISLINKISGWILIALVISVWLL